MIINDLFNNKKTLVAEFAPGGGGDDDYQDPYGAPKPEHYDRSIDFFGQFEADHFDEEDMNDATGEFRGYWGRDQIAYFKFDNPRRTGSDDPGVGWYYEPKSDGNSKITSAEPSVDNSNDREQQELGMIKAFLKSGQKPNPGSQIYNLMKRHGMTEGKKPDSYHIVNKDGKPATLASYADRASAEKDRDAKHPGAEVRQLGPRGKVKSVAEGSLKEFAPQSGGDSGNYFKELASAWYNGAYDSGSLEKGIKTNQDIERLLQRGIVAPDGKTRKYNIDYNSDFDGVIIFSDDYYDHSDYDDNGKEVDSRTGRPWGPYDYMEFKDEELDEGVAEGNIAPVSVGGTFDARPVVEIGSLVKASGLNGVYRVMDILRDEAKIVQEIPNTGQSTYFPMSDLRVWTNKPISEQEVPVHRIGLTVTDPNHPMVSKRKEQYQKSVRVPAADREKAINTAIAHLRRKGYKVLDHYYLGTVEPVNELDKNTVKNWIRRQPERIKGDAGLSRTNFKKAKRLVDKSIPSAMAKYKDPNYGQQQPRLDEVSLGNYRKKAAVSQAGAKMDRFFGRDDPATVAAADQTIAKRERGLARADARIKPYTPPPHDAEKYQRELTAKYPNIDDLVAQAEKNRDPDYEYAEGPAYYAGREAEHNYQKLKQIQRVIQGLNESLQRTHLP